MAEAQAGRLASCHLEAREEFVALPGGMRPATMGK